MFHLETQKAKWTDEPNSTGQCPRCAGMDSKRHRTTECAALAIAFEGFDSVMTTLNRLDDMHHDLPVLCVHPFADAILQMQYCKIRSILLKLRPLFSSTTSNVSADRFHGWLLL